MILISSKDNLRVKQLVKLQKSARFRRQSELFVAEGLRVCADAMRSGAVIKTLYVTEQAAEKYSSQYEQLSAYAEETVMLADNIFAAVSDTQTPQGFLCTIKTLDKNAHFDTINNGGKFLALENIQDPNNLGTILRSAEAFAVSGVILSSDCCDIYNPKVVRGSMGAVFRMPFCICDTIPNYLCANPQLCSYAAVVNSDAEPITETGFQAPCVTVIGNEGNGLRQETVSACNHRITIPMKGKAESLNASAAATIIIWEMIR